jgi:hypothetical protein
MALYILHSVLKTSYRLLSPLNGMGSIPFRLFLGGAAGCAEATAAPPPPLWLGPAIAVVCTGCVRVADRVNMVVGEVILRALMVWSMGVCHGLQGLWLKVSVIRVSYLLW